ncbi:MAG: rplQ [Phycisphaerales bacterium]|nr:rplQ [Phycisphaerales bacterium]
MSRHLIRGRQLSRDTEHRIALRRNMAQSLFEHGKIKTTLPKAKEVQGFVEKLITLARKNTLTARRRVIAQLNDRRVTDENQDFILNDKGFEKTVVQRLFDEVAPRYVGRPGGYTRIIKLGTWRIGDAGDIVQLELIGDEKKPTGTVRRAAGLRKKRTDKKVAFANAALKKGKGEPVAAEAATA